MSSLHQTFQDAVKVALFLGVSFIWIDCLCIYQDSNDDWIQEASLMGKVYENGLCNISATEAKDSKGGLCVGRTAKIHQDCYVYSEWEDVENKQWRIMAAPFLLSWLLEGPALYRGWIVQERILAPRVLHFGPRQLYWECQNFDACETFVDGVPSKHITSESNRGIPFKKSRFDAVQSPSKIGLSDTRSILGAWRQIVNMYAECQLTREEDKLVAISGLAKTVQAALGGTPYYAGLFETSLLASLCWGTFLGTGKRPTQYRAPTWSWASIDGRILDWGCRGTDRQRSFELELASVVDVSVEPCTTDLTGQVEGGYIRLRGYLWTMGDVLASSAQNITPNAKINGISIPSGFPGKKPRISEDVDELGKNIHLMPIQWRNKQRRNVDCLMLQPTNFKTGTFLRYGYMDLDGDIFGIRASKLGGVTGVVNEEWMEYEEKVGDQCTICII